MLLLAPYGRSAATISLQRLFSLIALTRCENKIDFFEHPGQCSRLSHVSNILMFNSLQQTAKRRQFKSRSVNHQQREQSAEKPLWTNFKFIPYSLAQLVLCALGTVCLHCSITMHPGYSGTFMTWLRIKHAVCLASRLIRSVSRSVEKHNILQVRHSRLSLK